MVCAAVFDTNQKKRESIREWMVRYLIQSGREMDVLWFTEPASGQKIEKYGRRIHLAFISLDEANGVETGRELYRQNPECRICYYQEQPAHLEPLLSSRPIAFYRWNETGGDSFCRKLEELMEELPAARDMFCHETKKAVYLIPYAHIRYFQSDLKYVQVHTEQGKEDERIFIKLSLIEEKLDQRFVRIHKSYIVNRAFIEYVDKSEHTVRLSGGETLPISDRWYESTVAELSDAAV